LESDRDCGRAKSALDFLEHAKPFGGTPFDDSHLVALDGSRQMTGVLRLANRTISDLLDAVPKVYLDSLITGAPLLVGVIDAATGDCRFTPQSGLTDGPLPDPDPTMLGDYVVCTTEGTISGGPADGSRCKKAIG
jgi:hypothetical protein